MPIDTISTRASALPMPRRRERPTRAQTVARRSPTLTPHELRRIVADLIG